MLYINYCENEILYIDACRSVIQKGHAISTDHKNGNLISKPTAWNFLKEDLVMSLNLTLWCCHCALE